MNKENYSSKDILLYLLFISIGVILVLLSFLVVKNTVGSNLFLNIGATFISTSLVFFLYQYFSQTKNIDQIQKSIDQKLSRQMFEIQQCIQITERASKMGICNMWRERRNIESQYWNKFTAPALSEVWLFGIAELQYALDDNFHQIVSKGTSLGCCYKILLLDPKSAAAEKLNQMEKGGEQVQGRIEGALRKFQELKEKNIKNRGTIEIKVCSRIPHVNIVRADSELLVTQYMPPLLGYSLFTIHVQRVTGGIFTQYEDYFKAMWQESQFWQMEQN